MKTIALLVLANLGIALSNKLYEEHDRLVTWRLRNIVNKYKYLATGNAEFSQWIEKVNNAATHSSFSLRMLTESDFKSYDRQRQMLEDNITQRLNTLRSLISLRKGGKRCVRFYQHQENELKNAYKLSNQRKQELYINNGMECPTRPVIQRYDYDYYGDY
ncbi:uncharacterized protein LOC6732966 [Drosophila simulans]|uniref:GD24269 n=1 Tax=Drosophila simulans TaxID=7240 RepID=B4Q3F2_DROSI|nr:uncharacterized protein LOC6732966 [Drosophila simulans]EDX05633.1 GD24269 [Drosophila simulans]KMY91174.1 uncharacterized protein Dsimw501_GD24269 [Drosophila simulans]